MRAVEKFQAPEFNEGDVSARQFDLKVTGTVKPKDPSLYKIVDVVIGLRVTTDEEREGLDVTDHGERAYNY